MNPNFAITGDRADSIDRPSGRPARRTVSMFSPQVASCTSPAPHAHGPAAAAEIRTEFTGPGGTYYVEPWVDGTYYVLRDGSPARDGIVAHLLDFDAAALIASQKARALY